MMKVKKTTLRIVGAVSAVGILVSLYVIIDHRRRDKLTVALIEELNKLLNPSASGLKAEEAFDIHFSDEIAKNVKGILLIKTDLAAKLAKDINAAFGILGDDEQKIYSVFRSLKDKVQISQVAKAYYNTYGVNLIYKLKSKLNESEVTEVLKIVNALPRYRIAA